MKFDWILAMLARPSLIRRAMHLSRRFRDVFSHAEIESLVDDGLAHAVDKFVPHRGRFRSFAQTFVDRKVLRGIARELRWRGRISDTDTHELHDPTERADADAIKSEVQALLGSDYSTYISHYAYLRSMREISRTERRSIRSVRQSIRRASIRLYERYGYRPSRPRSPRR